MPLADVQLQFKNMILGEHGDVLLNDSFTGLFDSNNIDLDTRLHVYRNNVLEKLTKVLEITYPTIHALVGEDFFKQVAKLYIRKSPPTGGCVNLYGESFPDYINTFKETSPLPYLYDVALYDWYFNTAFYAPNDEPINNQLLGALSPEEFSKKICVFRSSVHLIESNYPLTSIREFCDPENPNKDDNIDINKGGEKLLVYRPDLKIKVLLLENDEFLMLTCLNTKKTIEESLEIVISSHPAFDFQAFLQKIFSLEIFSNFK